MSGGNSNITQVPFSVIYLEHMQHRNYQHLTRCVVEKMRGESRREFLYTLDEDCGLFKIVDEAEGLQGDLLYEIWLRRDYGAPITELVKTQDVAEKTVRNKCTGMAKEELIYSKKGKWWITPKGAKQLALDNATLAGAVGEWLNSQPVSQAKGGRKSGNSSKPAAVQAI